MSVHSPQALALLGPTASGKTALALQLAKNFPCEIISLDSALVYRDMNIGTAKPSPQEQAIAPHHLIDIISPMQTYNAADFVRDCTRLIQEIRQRNRLPLIVGGTMMYYHALTQGLNPLPEANAAIRAQLQHDKETHGLAFLYAQLTQIDPLSAQRFSPNDAQRIERALEVYQLTGKPLSEHFTQNHNTYRAPSLYTIALIPEDRKRLHQQINQRFQQMIDNGLPDELQQLRQIYPHLNPNMPAMRCVGYRQTWSYLDGEISNTAYREQGQAATRQLAKRQLTWLRKLPTHAQLNPYHPTYQQTAHRLLAPFFDKLNFTSLPNPTDERTHHH